MAASSEDGFEASPEVSPEVSPGVGPGATSGKGKNFAGLSLRARLALGLAAVVVPMLLAAFAVLVAHQRLADATADYLNEDNRIRILALHSRAVLAAAGATADSQQAALRDIRNDLHDAAAVASGSLKKEAQDLGLLSYDIATLDQLAAGLPQFSRHAADNSSAAAASLERLQRQTRLVVLIAPLLALVLGLTLAAFITRGIYLALHGCVAFARDVAEDRNPQRLHFDSGSEFDLLAVAVNDILDEARYNAQVRNTQEQQIVQLERASMLRAACSGAVAAATSEEDLLQAFCEQLVEPGGYRFAWIGYARHDADSSIELMAHAGTDRDLVEQFNLSWGPDLRRHAGCGSVVLLKRMQVTRDPADDPGFAAWRGALLARRLACCVALPLMHEDEIYGALSLYSSDPHRFDKEELALLQELARELSHGIAGHREAGQRKRVEALLEHQVNFDPLTGLANRAMLEQRLAQAAAEAKDSGKQLAALFIDLDRFKDVNDSCGYKAGDQMLIEVAQLLEGMAGEKAQLARLANDEFVLLLPGLASGAEAGELATAILARLDQPLPSGPPNVRPLASIGISLFPEDGPDAGALIRIADLAMNDAKSLGGNTFRFYAPAMNARMASRFSMEADLRQALARGELLMHYQPKVSLVSGAITGAEALMRWRHPERGMVAPLQFIKLAEETGLVLPLGAWAISCVCGQMRRWLDDGLTVPAVAVNLSPRQFHQKDLVQVVRKALADNRLEPRLLELEITESAVMHDVEAAIAILAQLKELGVSISLDDFGTGYSSLSYLKRFPIDHLKIDRSFVSDITTSPDDAAICNAVIALAHHMNISVIAEGVETEGQMLYLRRRHCDEMQGFYFSKAVAGDAFAQLLSSNRKMAVPMESGQRTLLLLDDEVNILRALSRTLRPDGYKILTATTASEAFALLAVNEVQVVVSDQRMPEMSGTEFLSKVKDLYPDTVRIILSGYADLESVIEAINRGAIYRFFTKPWEDQLLRTCIGEAFRHQRLMHSDADKLEA
jgi:diguanylate cyclase (GGDEF)-like protein